MKRLLSRLWHQPLVLQQSNIVILQAHRQHLLAHVYQAGGIILLLYTITHCKTLDEAQHSLPTMALSIWSFSGHNSINTRRTISRCMLTRDASTVLSNGSMRVILANVGHISRLDRVLRL